MHQTSLRCRRQARHHPTFIKMDDLNSSDIEFGPPEVSKQTTTTAGQTSIDDIIANAASYRLTSKRRLKQLEFGHGAPSTQYSQSLWVRRFNTFRQHALKQDITIPFTGDDIIRFFDTMIGKLLTYIVILMDIDSRRR
jgi:hypothetical protein